MITPTTTNTTTSFLLLRGRSSCHGSHKKNDNHDDRQEEDTGPSPPGSSPANKNSHTLTLLLEARDWGAILEEVQYISPKELLEECLDIKNFYQNEDDDHGHHEPDRRRRHKMTGESHKMLHDSPCCVRVNLLHLACGLSAVPSYVIKAICQANPRVLYSTEVTYQRNALHIACLKGTDFTTIATLLEIDEKNHRDHSDHHDSKKILAETPDLRGRLPIHYAAMDRSVSGEKNLRLLLKAAPRSLMVQDIDGYAPLHIACETGQPMSMIRLFLLTAPDSIVLRTNKKEDAAHFARQCNRGLWTAKDQVAIVDYLENVALVTKIAIARLGPCPCTYLGKDEINDDAAATSNMQPPVGEIQQKNNPCSSGFLVAEGRLNGYSPLRKISHAVSRKGIRR